MNNVVFKSKLLPYALVLPQLVITIVFFFLPAGQAIWQSFNQQDAFGITTYFVGLDNYVELFSDGDYFHSLWISFFFAGLVTIGGLSIALILAVMADRVIHASGIYKTFLIWPYAIAPSVVGVLWSFLFSPSVGTIANYFHFFGIDWNPRLSSGDAMAMVVLGAIWKQISYNFLFFLAGLQAIPKSLIEAAAIDGASPVKRFWHIKFPLLSPTTFFLLVINLIYAFFETFAIIDTTTEGGPGSSTNILVYSAFKAAYKNFNYGSSGAQSVILMIIVIGLTIFQFKYIDRKVQY
ncbi:MAG: sn-glycerol-3-phosphate ABC transporter permease UgpA [Alcaligenaceae bacterium]|nr:sn-glycerol-3-phosphate ABC transporter permease UgpA [Alcaligenaceae bacterium]